MNTLFDYVNDILHGKKNIADETFEKNYAPFMVNRALSYHDDCIMYANEMNSRHFIPKTPQYLFLLNTIRAKKRKFSKWGKPETDDKINLIKDYFGYSYIKAREVVELISNDDIEKIKIITDKGGLK